MTAIGRIGIVDYGLGNIKSVCRAVENSGYQPVLVDDQKQIQSHQALILPGVGSFSSAAERLESKEMVSPLLEHISSDKKLLGICLGMQLLFNKGYEHGVKKGLGVVSGEVVPILSSVSPGDSFRLPIIGYKQLLSSTDPDPLLSKFAGGYYYFLHSFKALPLADSATTKGFTEHIGQKILAYVRKGNTLGLQFHPEKSGASGLRIIKDFFSDNY